MVTRVSWCKLSRFGRSRKMSESPLHGGRGGHINSMRARISKISLIFFPIVLLLGGLVDMGAEGYCVLMLIFALLASLPIVLGSWTHKVMGFGLLLLSLFLVAHAYQARKRGDERLHRILATLTNGQGTVSGTGQSSNLPPRLP
jgi:hypothetical protein